MELVHGLVPLTEQQFKQGKVLVARDRGLTFRLLGCLQLLPDRGQLLFRFLPLLLCLFLSLRSFVHFGLHPGLRFPAGLLQSLLVYLHSNLHRFLTQGLQFSLGFG